MVNIILWFGSVLVPSGCRLQWKTRQKRQDRGTLRERSTELHPVAHMGLLDQHWTFHNLFCAGLLSFSLLGVELAVVCVYTSCQLFSLRHTASLWNTDVSGIAGAQKCSSTLWTPELFNGTNNHINICMNWDTCFTTHIKSQMDKEIKRRERGEVFGWMEFVENSYSVLVADAATICYGRGEMFEVDVSLVRWIH